MKYHKYVLDPYKIPGHIPQNFFPIGLTLVKHSLIKYSWVHIPNQNAICAFNLRISYKYNYFNSKHSISAM